jgi:hypothetical protein
MFALRAALVFVLTLGGTGTTAQVWQPLGPDDVNWPCDEDVWPGGLALDPSGQPIIVFGDQGQNGRITVRKWAGSYWQDVGPRGFAASYGSARIATNHAGELFVAYRDPTHGYRITVQRWDGETWSVFGPAGFTPNTAYLMAFAVNGDGEPIVVFTDGSQTRQLSVWSWIAEGWGPLGSDEITPSDVSYVELALDGAGRPVVAYRDDSNGKRSTVQRWSGSAWEGVGAVGFTPDSIAYQSIALDGSGNPVLAYREIGNAFTFNTTVQRWDGSSWVFVGARGTGSGWTLGPRVAVDGAGGIVLAYIKDNGSGYLLKAQRWDGATWSPIGDPQGVGGTFPLALALTGSGVPITAHSHLAYGGRTVVLRWVQDACEVLGELGFSNFGGLTQAGNVSLAIDLQGKPVVAYSGYDGLNVKEWTGSTWQLIGPVVSANGTNATLAIDHLGRALVAYQDGAFQRATVRWLNGETWEPVGPIQFSAMQAYWLTMTLDANGTPYVAYQDRASGYKTTVQRWDGSAWEILGQAGFTSAPAIRQCLAIDDSGAPTVAHLVSDAVVVHRWNGISWQQLGPYGPGAWSSSTLSMVLDRTGAPVVAYSTGSSTHDVKVQRWNGTGWEFLGTQILGAEYAQNICLTKDLANDLVLGYTKDGCTVQRWNGTEWEVVGAPNFTSNVTAYSRQWLRPNGRGDLVAAYASGGVYAKVYRGGEQGMATSIGQLILGPNPCAGDQVWIRLVGLPEATTSVDLALVDMAGRLVFKRSMPVAQGALNADLRLPAGLANGLYSTIVVLGQDQWTARLAVFNE